MKKCPYCSGALEDNARFCFHCMTSLVEKETPRIPRRISAKTVCTLAACAVLVIAAAVALPLALSRKGGVVLPETADEELLQGEENGVAYPSGGEAETEAPEENAVPSYDEKQSSAGDGEEKQSSAPDASPDASSAPDSSSAPDKSSPRSEDARDVTPIYTPVSDETDGGAGYEAPQGGSQSAAQDVPQNETQDETQDETQNETQDETPSYAEEPQKTVFPASDAVYTYRKASQGDDFVYSYNFSSSDIVITGVKKTASNGVYVIPETIDGFTVREIMSYAFTDASVAGTVRTVVIPSTVRTVHDAFLDCVNLKHVYVKRKSINISGSAFHCYAPRTDAPLVFHCSADCDDMDFRYYKNIYGSGEYEDIVWEEWNG